jgi:hypothetical protein
MITENTFCSCGVKHRTIISSLSFCTANKPLLMDKGLGEWEQYYSFKKLKSCHKCLGMAYDCTRWAYNRSDLKSHELIENSIKIANRKGY